jgi:phospholipid/cholesterol/gamma-HCH transport system permease protein
MTRAARPPTRRFDPRPAPRGLLQETGDIAQFAVALLRSLRHVGPYLGEALRQAAIIATGSTLVIVLITFFAGASCGLEGSTLAAAFGAEAFGGAVAPVCTLREIVPFVFGYIVAAKIGCGMVAELGAMRVAEEVDAIEGLGIRSLTYLGATRLLGCAIVLPAAYLLSIASAYSAVYVMSIERFGNTSPGTWKLFFLSFQDGWDLAYSLTKGMLIALFVIVVALHHGYGLRGRGPVDVGIATARSMAVSIVGVTIISMAGTLIFWGADPRVPFG